MIAITGASGQLGQLVIRALLNRVPASEIVAAVRNPAKAMHLQMLGVQVREADYKRPDSLVSAFTGVEKVLLISSNELTQRLPQHQNVINAAQCAGVQLLAYTSLLQAPRSPLALAGEHLATEEYLAEKGISHVLLRNGWYTENYLACIPSALQHGALIGSAGEGRIASAACADYAEAAAIVLTAPMQAGKVYELAGDTAYTLSEFAVELSQQCGRTVPYVDMSEEAFKSTLIGVGLPESVASMLAECDTGVAQGALFDDGLQLSSLLARPTTALAPMISAALGQGLLL